MQGVATASAAIHAAANQRPSTVYWYLVTTQTDNDCKGQPPLCAHWNSGTLFTCTPEEGKKGGQSGTPE